MTSIAYARTASQSSSPADDKHASQDEAVTISITPPSEHGNTPPTRRTSLSLEDGSTSKSSIPRYVVSDVESPSDYIHSRPPRFIIFVLFAHITFIALFIGSFVVPSQLDLNTEGHWVDTHQWVRRLVGQAFVWSATLAEGHVLYSIASLHIGTLLDAGKGVPTGVVVALASGSFFSTVWYSKRRLMRLGAGQLIVMTALVVLVDGAMRVTLALDDDLTGAQCEFGGVVNTLRAGQRPDPALVDRSEFLDNFNFLNIVGGWQPSDYSQMGGRTYNGSCFTLPMTALMNDPTPRYYQMDSRHLCAESIIQVRKPNPGEITLPISINGSIAETCHGSEDPEDENTICHTASFEDVSVVGTSEINGNSLNSTFYMSVSADSPSGTGSDDNYTEFCEFVDDRCLITVEWILTLRIVPIAPYIYLPNHGVAYIPVNAPSKALSLVEEQEWINWTLQPIQSLMNMSTAVTNDTSLGVGVTVERTVREATADVLVAGVKQMRGNKDAFADLQYVYVRAAHMTWTNAQLDATVVQLATCNPQSHRGRPAIPLLFTISTAIALAIWYILESTVRRYNTLRNMLSTQHGWMNLILQSGDTLQIYRGSLDAQIVESDREIYIDAGSGVVKGGYGMGNGPMLRGKYGSVYGSGAVSSRG
ncbi:hypothetical protein HDV00_007575 [Rhizophlyctis rosea]|nr:hypothetical protein HDV00_007575 [Rhizophlyctis rosea]